MPAITVEDITTLERLPAPDPTLSPPRVRSVTTAPAGLEGEGFPVRRAFHGVELWVNLPGGQEWADARSRDLGAQEVALLSSEDGGALLRVIAGDVAGHSGPGDTYTPMTMVHATLSPGARFELPWRRDD